MNVIARNPTAASLRYVIGGDTAGLLVSQDDGTSWTAANAGLQDLSQTTIASVAFQDPPKDGEVYAAYGTAFATNSGLLHSADGGLTWTPVAATGTVLPIFNGGHSGGYPAYQVGASPRATGALLALDDHGGIPRHIYAGTFGQGVIRSDDGGLTWTRIALGSDETNPHCTFTTNNGTDHGCFVTGLLLSGIRGERDTLYVAVHGGDASTCVGDGICGGVFKVTKAACSGDGCADATTSRIAGTPVDPSNAEELTMVRGVLLCACGTDGFYAKGPHGPMLVQRNTNLAFDQSIQTCTSVVYVGTRAVDGDTTAAALYKSTPAGTFCDVTATAPLYAGAGGFPVQLAVGTDQAGTLMGYLVTIGNGVIVIKDASDPTCAAP